MVYGHAAQFGKGFVEAPFKGRDESFRLARVRGIGRVGVEFVDRSAVDAGPLGRFALHAVVEGDRVERVVAVQAREPGPARVTLAVGPEAHDRVGLRRRHACDVVGEFRQAGHRALEHAAQACRVRG